jgi:nicotinamide-nucleotide amidase
VTSHVHRAEVLSIGSELTHGETRDTNAGELAADLTAEGVVVTRLTGVPDDQGAVVDAWRRAMTDNDLVVSTGGLGPTPDDLTREAIAAVVGETPAVDGELEAWLRRLWRRRRLPFPEINLKQAWLIPSATAIRNDNGTAPGWWVEPAGGRRPILVALPGPPREMRPMWHDSVLPRLRAGGLGVDDAVTTLRTTGIGESQLAALIGEELLAGDNPSVATYARQDAVDVRIGAVAAGDRPAAAVLADAVARVREVAGEHVWAEGRDTWADAVAVAASERGWTIAVSEEGSGGSLARLLESMDRLVLAESRTGRDGLGPAETGPDAMDLARRIRQVAGSEIGIGLVARPAGADTAVDIAIVSPAGDHRETRTAFLQGVQGRHRAGLAGAAVLLRHLRGAADR